jgi:hypothetical protein
MEGLTIDNSVPSGHIHLEVGNSYWKKCTKENRNEEKSDRSRSAVLDA